MYRIILVVSSLMGASRGNMIFFNDGLGDVEKRIEKGCSNEIQNVRSRVECVSRCGSDLSCIGASVDDNGSCFHHRECPQLPDTPMEYDNNHRYLAKYCAHGTWNPSTGSCDCVGGSFGERCKQFHKGCWDLWVAGYGVGLHKVFIDPDRDGDKPFQVICVLKSARVYLYLYRKTASGGFNKTWSEYADGFHIDDDNFWLGMYAWQRITAMGSTYCHNVEFYNSVLVLHHIDPLVSNEDGQYSFTSLNVTSPYSNPACVGPLSNAPFSTWDVDNDADATENCAAVSGTGWWFRNCNDSCNFMESIGYSTTVCNFYP